MPNNIYSTKQAAALLGLHPTTVRTYTQEGGIFEGIGEVIGHSRVYLEADVEKMKLALDRQPEPGRKPDGAGVARRVKPLCAADRYKLALKMREAGRSLEEIRAKLGYSRTSSVSRAIHLAKQAAA
jgi:hypothetical protein